MSVAQAGFEWVLIGALVSVAVGVAGKLIYDGIRSGKQDDTRSIKTSGNNKNGRQKTLTIDDMATLRTTFRCESHDHLAAGVSEMIGLQKQGHLLQQELARRMDGISTTMKDDFTETFDRLRAVEGRIGGVEGQVMALEERVGKHET